MSFSARGQVLPRWGLARALTIVLWFHAGCSYHVCEDRTLIGLPFGCAPRASPKAPGSSTGTEVPEGKDGSAIRECSDGVG